MTYMKWILLFITAFLLTSCGWKFDRKLWEKKDVYYYCRDKMVKDVMKNHLYVGMTYGAVVEMLGTGDYEPDSLMITYEIWVDYFGIDPVKIENLNVEFTPDSLVSGFYLTKWKEGDEHYSRQ